MLTDEYISQCSDAILALYNSFIDYSIVEIAKYLKKYYSISEVSRRANMLVLSGQLKKDIVKKVAKLNKMSQKQVHKLLFDAGAVTLKFDDAIYKASGLKPLEFLESDTLKNIIYAEIENTNGLLSNLTKTTADKVQKEFINSVDVAEMQVQSGLYDYNTAIKNSINNIVENGGGTKITYPTGATSTLDVAVRRCVLTGVSQSASKLQLERAREMKAPYCDTSAHEGARPTHEEWQGKRFRLFDGPDADMSIKNFLTEPFGTAGKPVYEQIQEYNCRHSWYPVMRKDAPMARTKKQLKDINNKTVESDGKTYTYYEAEQRLRQMERTVRKYKRKKMALESYGQDASQETLKIKQWQGKIRKFVSDTGIKRRSENEQVYF